MNKGIDTSPKNFNVFTTAFCIKLFFSKFDSSALFIDTDAYFAGLEIPPNAWLVKPSIPFDSNRRAAIGDRIKIKISINSENLRYDFLLLWNFKKKIIDNGIKNNKDSYLTIEARLRNTNDNV